jgi:hypothetical protein
MTINTKQNTDNTHKGYLDVPYRIGIDRSDTGDNYAIAILDDKSNKHHNITDEQPTGMNVLSIEDEFINLNEIILNTLNSENLTVQQRKENANKAEADCEVARDAAKLTRHSYINKTKEVEGAIYHIKSIIDIAASSAYSYKAGAANIPMRDRWLDSYFKLTGECKQDYINFIERNERTS